MRIALATGAWTRQTHGVVTTLKATAAALTGLGHEVHLISPQALTTIAGPLGLAVCRYCLARRLPFTMPGPLDVIEAGVTGMLHEDLACAIAGALRLERRACVAAASAFSWHAATAQFLAGLAPIPLPLRGRLAVSRSSAMIARMAARRQASGAGDTN